MLLPSSEAEHSHGSNPISPISLRTRIMLNQRLSRCLKPSRVSRPSLRRSSVRLMRKGLRHDKFDNSSRRDLLLRTIPSFNNWPHTSTGMTTLKHPPSMLGLVITSRITGSRTPLTHWTTWSRKLLSLIIDISKEEWRRKDTSPLQEVTEPTTDTNHAPTTTLDTMENRWISMP